MIRKTPWIAKTLLLLSGMGIKKSQKLPWASLLRQAELSVLSIHEDLQTLENRFEKVEEDIQAFSHPVKNCVSEVKN